MILARVASKVEPLRQQLDAKSDPREAQELIQENPGGSENNAVLNAEQEYLVEQQKELSPSSNFLPSRPSQTPLNPPLPNSSESKGSSSRGLGTGQMVTGTNLTSGLVGGRAVFPNSQGSSLRVPLAPLTKRTVDTRATSKKGKQIEQNTETTKRQTSEKPLLAIEKPKLIEADLNIGAASSSSKESTSPFQGYPLFSEIEIGSPQIKQTSSDQSIEKAPKTKLEKAQSLPLPQIEKQPIAKRASSLPTPKELKLKAENQPETVDSQIASSDIPSTREKKAADLKRHPVLNWSQKWQELREPGPVYASQLKHEQVKSIDGNLLTEEQVFVERQLKSKVPEYFGEHLENKGKSISNNIHRAEFMWNEINYEKKSVKYTLSACGGHKSLSKLKAILNGFDCPAIEGWTFTFGGENTQLDHPFTRILESAAGVCGPLTNDETWVVAFNAQGHKQVSDAQYKADRTITVSKLLEVPENEKVDRVACFENNKENVISMVKRYPYAFGCRTQRDLDIMVLNVEDSHTQRIQDVEERFQHEFGSCRNEDISKAMLNGAFAKDVTDWLDNISHVLSRGPTVKACKKIGDYLVEVKTYFKAQEQVFLSTNGGIREFMWNDLESAVILTA